jgi:hypothetical protein
MQPALQQTIDYYTKRATFTDLRRASAAIGNPCHAKMSIETLGVYQVH